jgi:hypothetical protein
MVLAFLCALQVGRTASASSSACSTASSASSSYETPLKANGHASAISHSKQVCDTRFFMQHPFLDDT